MNLKTIDAERLARRIVKNGGATVEYAATGRFRVVDGTETDDEGQPRVWAVGIRHRHNLAVLLPVDDERRVIIVERWLRYWRNRADYRRYYLGAWIAGGRLYLDHVRTLADRELALLLADANDQEAIYNLATGETVAVKEGK